MIRLVNQQDAGPMAHIYNYYVLNSTITFEEQSISHKEMSARIDEILTANLPWLVIEEEGALVGYAYASKWKGRCAYRFSVEVTIYFSRTMCGRGLGFELYNALFDEIRSRSFHAVIGGIAIPNPASIALHEKLGMDKVAHFKEVGYKFGKWIDVGYWQKLL